MWQPKTITFKNLFSHPYTQFDFKLGEMILLLGMVEDEDGADSNGAGKSTIIEAITLAITGNVYREVKKDDFIREGQKSCFVIMEMSNPVLQQEMRIERTFFNNTTSSTCRIFLNEEEQTQLTKPELKNAFIYDTLGVSKEDFLNYFVIGQGNNNSFFASGDAEQKAIIGRFSNFSDIDKLTKEISIKQNRAIITESELVVAIEGKFELINQLNELIAKGNESKEAEYKKKLQDIEESRVEALNKVGELSEKIKANNSIIEKKIKELDAVRAKMEDIEVLKSQLVEINKRRLDKMKEVVNCQELKGQLSIHKGSAVECPKCGNKFIPAVDMTLQEVFDNLTVVEETFNDLNFELNSIEQEKNTVQEQMEQVRENEAKIKVLKREISSYNDIKKQNEDYIWQWQQEVLDLDAEKLKLNKDKNKDHINIKELKSKLQLQVDERNNLEDQLRSIRSVISECKFFEYHFSRAGFKTYLANKSIKSIQDLCNFYLNKFETNLQVSISGFTVLKSKEVRDKIEVTVIKNGVKKGLFAKYSGGQKSRVNLCGIIALQKLINNTAAYGKGLDLLVLDELSALDATGQREIIKILEKAQLTTVLVLHNVKDLPCRNKMYVKYKNEKSTLEPLKTTLVA